MHGLNIGKRYIEGKPLDGGGMGDVFQFKDSYLDRFVAVKKVKLGGDKTRIFDEIVALQSLRSKHIVEIYDVIMCDNDEIAIVEEYVCGNEINQKIEKKEAIRSFFQLASALKDIHAQGVIHRDIKPSNLKIDSNNVLKVFDFGLARSIDQAKTKGFRGTFVFAAPELYSDATVAFTEAIDVYAFGVTCAFMLLGEKEFSKRITPKIPPCFLRYSFQESIKDSEFCDLAEILNRCIEKDLEKRPKILEVYQLLKRKLLRGRHEGALAYNDKIYKIKEGSSRQRVKNNWGSVIIGYDGYDFYAEKPEREVYINALHISDRYKLYKSCLISIGDADTREGYERLFVPFDSTHPEVVI